MQKIIFTFTYLLVLLPALVFAQGKQSLLLYQNPSLSPQVRAQDLLARMTLEEKIGQMTQIATPEISPNTTAKSKAERFRPFIDEAKLRKLLKAYPIGSFLAGFAVPPATWYEFSNQLQKINLEESRLKIPIIYGNDNVHGPNYVSGATIFPQPFNLAATFDTGLAAQMGRITTEETGELGQHWNFAPILDVGRNPYWPRQYETFGEDPYWISCMGTAYIKAQQGKTGASPYKIASTAKHFLGYSDPTSGYDRAPARIPDQELREIFLPPFRSAVQAGVKTFMINSGSVNGVPVHASKAILTDLLRKELGFDGVIVTDWADILQLVGEHKVAADEHDATRMALEAGIDMSMTASSTSFCDVVKDLVQSGELAQSVVDNACLRILRLKFDLGLFENPYPSKRNIGAIGSPKNQAVALDAAQKSIVLLQNDGVLPLEKPTSILLAGPASASRRNLSGGWTVEWEGGPEALMPQLPTLYETLTKAYPTAKIDTVATRPDGKGMIADNDFAAKAANAGAIILALGEEPYAEGKGNINNLALPATQLRLVDLAKASGKPVVIVMVAGRPRLIPDVKKKCNAFIFAGLPGPQGGIALASIISGGVNPAGKLAISYPDAEGHQMPYNHPVHDRSTHAFPFGSGLQYTTYAYSNLQVSDTLVNQNQTTRASVLVKNTGKRAGTETLLFYVKDHVRTISPLAKQLRHVVKLNLAPGEEKEASFLIEPTRDLAFPDAKGNQLLESGTFSVEVGGLKKGFIVTGPDGKRGGKRANGKPYLQVDLYE